MTNALINARKAVEKSGEVENVPVLSTSVAYGVYMAVSSNLRYDVGFYFYSCFCGFKFLNFLDDDKKSIISTVELETTQGPMPFPIRGEPEVG